MQIEAILFADRATVSDGLLEVEGGGWEHWQPVLFPATISGYVAGVIALDARERGEITEVVLELSDDSGQVEGFRASMTANGTRPKTAEGVPYRVAFAIPFMIVVRGPTVLKARLESGGTELHTLAFSIRDSTPDVLPEHF